MKHSEKLNIAGVDIGLGETVDIFLPISEDYLGAQVGVSIRVMRAPKPGPALFLSAVVHGDEITGLGIIREIMLDPPRLEAGTLICLPVANPYGFNSHTRYLPDRRDLNRAFPGDSGGNLALRLSGIIYKEVIQNSDYGIDLHAAAARRTNFPHIRVDLSRPEAKEIAFAFGCELVVDGKGPEGSLRRVATDNGCATLLYEAGESLKFEPGPIKIGLRGVYNVMSKLGMLGGEMAMPAYQKLILKTKWVRSNDGGLLKFHVSPGELVEKGDVVATCEKIFTDEADPILAPESGVILSMTTLPAVKPGEPVCHLAIVEDSLEEIRSRIASAETLHRETQEELSSSFHVEPAEED